MRYFPFHNNVRLQNYEFFLFRILYNLIPISQLVTDIDTYGQKTSLRKISTIEWKKDFHENKFEFNAFEKARKRFILIRNIQF